MHPFSGHQLALAERAPAPIRLSKSEVLPLYSSSTYQPARGHTCHPSTKSDRQAQEALQQAEAREKDKRGLVSDQACVLRFSDTKHRQREALEPRRAALSPHILVAFGRSPRHSSSLCPALNLGYVTPSEHSAICLEIFMAYGGTLAHHNLQSARREVFGLLPRRLLRRLVCLQQAEMLPLSQGQPIGHSSADGDRLAPVKRQPLRYLLHWCLCRNGQRNARSEYVQALKQLWETLDVEKSGKHHVQQ